MWFSAGAASAVATKLVLADTENVVVAYIDPGSEHPDAQRFIADCEKWFDHPGTRLKSDRYEDTWDVWNKRRYIVGPGGALCTAEMKKMVRYKFERPDDIQCFGYTSEESSRADRFREQNPGVTLRTPLIEHGVSKSDCLEMVKRAGIELHAMYKLGYQNANCVGCPKGGMFYWNKIRRDFPEVFQRMAELERKLNATCIRTGGQRVFLDELDPKRGRRSQEPDTECSLVCASAEDAINADWL